MYVYKYIYKICTKIGKSVNAGNHNCKYTVNNVICFQAIPHTYNQNR